MSQLIRDREGRIIPYDRLCICSHIASEHWVSDKKGNLFLSNCRECTSNKWLLDHLQCMEFRQDNLKYLEQRYEEKQ